ncbi:hypothetical protein PVK06_009305 [Gossypium arboreum]|uniref:DUF7745 domain-containing protein n=1 Tax=Gossypium arboreum TaxID=29729 RepID=A0ABR0QM46_GOSAR|nr:hypothetical protein PVK06_009305 [Gossypium arboreum]
MTAMVTPLSGSEKLCFREVFTSVWASGLLPGYICTYVFVRFSSPYGHREMCPPEPNLNYGDLPYLLDIKVDKYLFRGMVQFWNPAYSCFTFGEVDLVPTLEEDTTLLHYPKIQVGHSSSQQKGDGKCIPLASLRDLILAHLDVKKRVDILALSIYGLLIFPKAIGHIDEAVANLFNRLGKQNTTVPAILAETFRSLSACRRAGEGRFIGCAQLLLIWFHSHFWKVDKVPCRVFFEDYSTLREAVVTPRRDDIKKKGGWKYFRISERKM